MSKQKPNRTSLVFFRTLDKKNVFHVGIFIGQNDFIHAPGKHRTVTRSTLANPYFKKHFLGAKSFLQTIGPQKKSLE
ncbi:MAG: C40 family peptidase [Desulfobacter sp.]|nr:C40 family peptidase [Desulfobacter sp.]